MNDLWRSIAFRLVTDPGFFVVYFLILGGVVVELIRCSVAHDRRRRRFLALILYPLLVVTIAGLFLTLGSPTAFSFYDDEGIEDRVSVDFGERIELVGYTIDDPTIQAGESIRLILYWRSIGHIPLDYNAFVHITDADGTMVVQGDRSAGGDLSTTYWLPGELIEDEYLLPLPDDLLPGQYTIVVGLYQWWDGVRLPAYRDGERIPNDAVVFPEPIYVFEN